MIALLRKRQAGFVAKSGFFAFPKFSRTAEESPTTTSFVIFSGDSGRFILLAVQIEASFVGPLPRSKRNHRHCGSFQVSLDFSMASIQTARVIKHLEMSNFKVKTCGGSSAGIG